MTALTAEPVTVVETDEAAEHAKLCDVSKLTGKPCGRKAAFRAFVTCPAGHERTTLLCAGHNAGIQARKIFCRPCPDVTPVWVVISEPLR